MGKGNTLTTTLTTAVIEATATSNTATRLLTSIAARATATVTTISESILFPAIDLGGVGIIVIVVILRRRP